MKPSSSHEQGDLLKNRDLIELTRREWEVLLQVANDLTNAEIAERLCLTIKSVENYRTRIGSKLNMKGVRLLDRFARRHSTELRHWFQLLTGETPPPLHNALIIRLINVRQKVFTGITPDFVRGLLY